MSDALKTDQPHPNPQPAPAAAPVVHIGDFSLAADTADTGTLPEDLFTLGSSESRLIGPANGLITGVQLFLQHTAVITGTIDLACYGVDANGKALKIPNASGNFVETLALAAADMVEVDTGVFRTFAVLGARWDLLGFKYLLPYIESAAPAGTIGAKPF